jgi:hypothetical protein
LLVGITSERLELAGHTHEFGVPRFVRHCVNTLCRWDTCAEGKTALGPQGTAVTRRARVYSVPVSREICDS